MSKALTSEDFSTSHNTCTLLKTGKNTFYAQFSMIRKQILKNSIKHARIWLKHLDKMYSDTTTETKTDSFFVSEHIPSTPPHL